MKRLLFCFVRLLLRPMLIHVGSEEILLADAEPLARRAVGAPVQLCRFDGVGHIFQFHAGLLREADKSIRVAGEFIEQVLAPRAVAA